MEPNDITGNTAELDQQQGVTQQGDETRVTEPDTQTAEEIAAAAEAAKEAAKPKVDNVQRRIDEITRKRHEEVGRATARAEAAERELAALRTPKTEEQQPTTFRPEDIDRIASERAERLVSKREFDSKCAALVDSGSKEYGDDFDKAVKNLGSLQAIVDEKGEFTDFAKLVVDTDEPHKMLKHLGDNPDEAARILNLSIEHTTRYPPRSEQSPASAFPCRLPKCVLNGTFGQGRHEHVDGEAQCSVGGELANPDISELPWLIPYLPPK
jgi:hypothetical protein